jgi:tRNA U34 2-thiouridine synthase MnmA/TrmU
MLRRAGEMLPELGCDFLSTGEVLDERPMSQNRRSLGIVAGDSGYEELILRPLSAKLLDPTVPEENGWVDREQLLDLHGRGRKRQFALAEEFGLTDYPSPTGGCRLTEPDFAARLKDMKEHEGLAGVRDIELLRVGRHFRLSPATKLVVGRNAKENAVIESVRELYDLMFKAESVPGPSALLPLTASDEEIALAAEICASYSDSPRDGKVVLRVKSATGLERMEVRPADRKDIEGLRI